MPIYKQTTEITKIDDVWANIDRDIVEVYFGDKNIFTVWGEYDSTLPITISANGDALIDYRIYGASGGVGEPTENLFDKNAQDPDNGFMDNRYLSDDGNISSNAYYQVSEYIVASGKTTYYLFSFVNSGTAVAICFYDENKSFVSGERILNKQSIVSPVGTRFLRITVQKTLRENSTLTIFPSASYIPYGYKLPMTVSDGNTTQTVPVYIGENQLDSVEGVSDYVDKSSGKIVRMIGEYTFTGDESFNKYGNSDVFYTSKTINPVGITTVNTTTMQCDHPAFTAIENKDTRYWLNPEADDICCFLPGGMSQVFLRSTSNFTTAAECKAYLKAQYDNGTPVKISYWLKTPIEEDPPVPLPEIPTINGETVIDYDGTPKPSQMYVKYRKQHS